VVCRLFAVSQTEGGWDVLIRCFDAGTGKQVLQSPPVWTNSALQLFAGGGLIGVDDSGRPWSASSQPSRHMHALWSFATNSVTRRWPPEVDATGGPLGFAISLDGGLIAGTASGSVRISRLASPGEHR
jgi:hypothetical protein